jgi:hypothetical protein
MKNGNDSRAPVVPSYNLATQEAELKKIEVQSQAGK